MEKCIEDKHYLVLLIIMILYENYCFYIKLNNEKGNGQKDHGVKQMGYL